MDKRKKTRLVVLIGFGLLAIAFLFKWTFIYSESIGDRLLEFIGIPTWSNGDMGLHYTIFITLALLISGLVILNKRFGKRTMYIILLVWILIPSNLFANVYQSHFATGVNALEYRPNNSHCDYDLNDADVLDGSCTLYFVNHSKKTVTFHAAVDLDDDNVGFNFNDLINNKLKRRQLRIEANEQRGFKVTLKQSLQSTGNQGGIRKL